MENLSDFFEKVSRPLVLWIAFVLSAVLAVAYSLIGAPLAFTLFFILPIAMVAFSAGNNAGMAIAIFSMISWLLADLLVSRPHNPLWVPLLNAMSNMAIFLFVVYGIDQFKNVLKRERECSHQDPLTGIPNLRGFFELAEREIMRARRKIAPLSVAYLELDHFDQVIEKHGKKTAEAILKKLASSLAGNIRGTDVGARIGEKEFILLMSETGIEGGMKGIRRVNNLLMQVIEEFEMPVSFSIGLVTYNILPETIEQMIKDSGSVKNQPHDPGSDPIQHRVVDL